MADIFTPTDWIDGTTVIDMARLKNGETQYLKVAGIQTLDALPAMPSAGQNVCRVGTVTYIWDGTAWRDVSIVLPPLLSGSLYISSDTTLSGTPPVSSVSTPISIDTTPTEHIWTAITTSDTTAQSNSAYRLFLHLSGLTAGETYTLASHWSVGASEIASGSNVITPDTSDVLVSVEMLNRLDTPELPIPLGSQAELMLSISKGTAGAQTIYVLSSQAEPSEIARNSGIISASDVYDQAGGVRVSQAEINRSFGTAIANEVTDRENADIALDTRIDTETSERTSADTTLQNNINTEAATRETNDTALGTRITTETADRTDADATLQGNIGLKVDKLQGISLAGQNVVIDAGGYISTEAKPTLGTAASKDVGTAQGQIPILGSNGKLSDSVIPPLAIGDYAGAVSAKADLITLTSAQKGDIAKVTTDTDVNNDGVWWLNGTYSTLADWIQIVGPGSVISVNGLSGIVTLTASDVQALPVSTLFGKTLTVSGRTVKLLDQNGGTLATITTQDTTYAVATATADGLMSSADRTKLDGIEAGAQVNDVVSVAGRVGAVVLTKADVGLGNVDNTADSAKPISTAMQAALDLKATVAALNSEATARQNADTAMNSHIQMVDDDLVMHIADVANPHAVTKAQVGLGSVDNTADLAKPISTATQAAIDAKLDKSQGAANAGKFMKVGTDGVLLPEAVPGGIELSSIAPVALGAAAAVGTGGYAARNDHVHPFPTKANIGLGNVDNTSDASKPISTAVQTALDGKQATGDYATNTALSSEASTRASADTTLQTNIDAKQDKELFFESLTASAWTADSTYSDYAYRCDVACTGVLATYWADVVMDVTEATSGDYAPVAICGAGYVRIYSKKSTSVTIPSIKVTVRA